MRSFIAIICGVGIATAQTGANCDVPCENYLTTLYNADALYSKNVYVPGGGFPRPQITVQSVCNNGNDLQTCFDCSKDGEGLNTQSDLTLLDAWWETCATYQAQGVDGAYACWLSVPSGSSQCAYRASEQDQGGQQNNPSNDDTTSDSSPTAGSIDLSNIKWLIYFTVVFVGVFINMFP